MPVNRIAKLLDDPPAPTIPPREDLKGRYQFVSDAVLKAIAATTKLLDNDDPAVVLKAAKMILDLDKTRMRHGEQVHGVYKPDYLDVLQQLGPVSGDVPRSTEVVAAELRQLENELAEDNFDDEDDFDDADDEPAIRPISSVLGTVPAPLCPPPPPTAKPPDDDEPADAQAEYQRWVTGYYHRDRATDPRPRMVGCS